MGEVKIWKMEVWSEPDLVDEGHQKFPACLLALGSLGLPYHFSCLSLEKSLVSSFRAGHHPGCIPAVQQSLCFFELLSHKYGTEAIKGRQVAVWPPLKAQLLSVKFICSEMAVATLSFHAGIRYYFILVSCLQYPTAPPKGQWVRKASPGWFWEINIAVCSQNSSIEPPVQAPSSITSGFLLSFLVLSI